MKFNGTLHHRAQQQSSCHDPYVKQINKIHDVIARATSNRSARGERACNSLVAPAQRFLSARARKLLYENRAFFIARSVHREVISRAGERYWISEKSPATYRRVSRCVHAWAIPRAVPRLSRSLSSPPPLSLPRRRRTSLRTNTPIIIRIPYR